MGMNFCKDCDNLFSVLCIEESVEYCRAENIERLYRINPKTGEKYCYARYKMIDEIRNNQDATCENFIPKRKRTFWEKLTGKNSPRPNELILGSDIIGGIPFE